MSDIDVLPFSRVSSPVPERLNVGDQPVVPEQVIAKLEIIAATTVVGDGSNLVTSVEPTPVAKVEPSPVAKVEPTPVAKVEPTPVAKVEPHPVAKVELKPSASVEPHPVAKVELKPSASVEPPPIAKIELKPSASVEPPPIAKIEPKPSASVEPTPIAKIEPKQTTAIKPKSIINIKPTTDQPTPDPAPTPSTPKPKHVTISPTTQPELRNHIKGMIYGLVLGDAVGLITEYKPKSPNSQPPIFPYNTSIRGFPVCDWTSNGDQMILMLETLFESEVNPLEEVINSIDITNFASKLVQWKEFGFPELGDKIGQGCSGHMSVALAADDYLTSPVLKSKQNWQHFKHKNATNSVLPRTPILALLNFADCNPDGIDPDFYHIIKSTCLLTHYDLRCVLSCYTVGTVLRNMLYALTKNKRPRLLNLKKITYRTCIAIIRTINPDHYPPVEAVDQKYVSTSDHPIYQLEQEFFDYFNMSLQQLNLFDAQNIGYVYKSMGSVLWAADVVTKCEMRIASGSSSGQLSFEKVVSKVAGECGSAVNVAMVGCVIGTYIGYDRLPKEWLDALPNRPWLDKKVDELLAKMIM